jgi:hypothetical protein
VHHTHVGAEASAQSGERCAWGEEIHCREHAAASGTANAAAPARHGSALGENASL